MSEEAKSIMDFRIPVALVVTIVLQSFAVIWWASAMTHRIAVIERQVEQSAEIVNVVSDDRGRIIRIETRLDNLTEIIVTAIRERAAADALQRRRDAEQDETERRGNLQ